MSLLGDGLLAHLPTQGLEALERTRRESRYTEADWREHHRLAAGRRAAEAHAAQQRQFDAAKHAKAINDDDIQARCQNSSFTGWSIGACDKV